MEQREGFIDPLQVPLISQTMSLRGIWLIIILNGRQPNSTVYPQCKSTSICGLYTEIFHIKIFLPENHFSAKTHSVRLLQENGSGKKLSKKKTFKHIGIYLKKMKAFFVILMRSDVILGSDSSWDVRGLQKTSLKFWRHFGEACGWKNWPEEFETQKFHLTSPKVQVLCF